MAKSKERHSGKGNRNPTLKSHEGTPKLADLGVSAKQSSRWQKLAAVPEEKFERALSGDAKPTTDGIIRENTAPKVTPVDPAALWLWGRLNDIEKRYLDLDPAGVLSTLTPEMFDDVRRMLPLAMSWLQRLAREVANGQKKERGEAEGEGEAEAPSPAAVRGNSRGHGDHRRNH